MKISIITLGAASLLLLSCAPKSNKSVESVSETQQAPAEPASNVKVMKASYSQVPVDGTYSSSVQAYVTNNIVSQSAGRIRKINVEVGDYVKEGSILAEMDRLQLDQARMKLTNDSTELSRIKGLYEKGGVSRSDYEAMELACKVSRSSYRNLLENTILRSPVSGVVTARNYDAGDMYAMSLPLFTVQQITPVKILVGVSESDYTKVKKGDEAVVNVEAFPGISFKGEVVRIYPTIDVASHTFLVEVLVENTDMVLRPGMYAKVKLVFGVNRSIVLPDAAVLKMQGAGQRYVFVVDENNIARLRNVEVGRLIGSGYEILSGIQEGENVVVSGNIALKSGNSVRIIE